MSLLIETAIDWTHEDIVFVREQRKFWANLEQRVTDKDVRKVCQKYIKAITIVLEYMTGRKGGKWDAEPLATSPAFPLELQPYIRTVFAFAGEGCGERIPFTEVYAYE